MGNKKMGERKMGERLKKRLQDFQINFKIKPFIFGFATVVALTLFRPALSVFAKDIPKGNLNDIVPAPAPVPVRAPSLPPVPQLINNAISGTAGMVCGEAASTGSYELGLFCGFIVMGSILYKEGKGIKIFLARLFNRFFNN